MADLSNLTLDRDVVRAGEWVPVNPGPDQFEIKTRGFTLAYKDGLSRIRRQAARDLNRKLKPGEAPFSPETLPPSIDDACQGQALADHCILDVRGLNNNGVPLTADEFRDLVRDPEGRTQLVILALGAAMEVGRTRQEEREEAQGNSSPASSSNSNGEEEKPS